MEKSTIQFLGEATAANAAYDATPMLDLIVKTLGNSPFVLCAYDSNGEGVRQYSNGNTKSQLGLLQICTTQTAKFLADSEEAKSKGKH